MSKYDLGVATDEKQRRGEGSEMLNVIYSASSIHKRQNDFAIFTQKFDQSNSIQFIHI